MIAKRRTKIRFLIWNLRSQTIFKTNVPRRPGSQRESKKADRTAVYFAENVLKTGFRGDFHVGISPNGLAIAGCTWETTSFERFLRYFATCFTAKRAVRVFTASWNSFACRQTSGPTVFAAVFSRASLTVTIIWTRVGGTFPGDVRVYVEFNNSRTTPLHTETRLATVNREQNATERAHNTYDLAKRVRPCETKSSSFQQEWTLVSDHGLTNLFRRYESVPCWCVSRHLRLCWSRRIRVLRTRTPCFRVVICFFSCLRPARPLCQTNFTPLCSIQRIPGSILYVIFFIWSSHVARGRPNGLLYL